MQRFTRALVALAAFFVVFSCLQHSVIASERNPLTGEPAMRITVTSNGNTVVYALNDSPASKALYDQLPLTIDVENYGGIEKIFYPPKKLDTTDTPLVKAAKPGTLAYYAPWGDVVMFYGTFGSAAGLYELGHAISDSKSIRSLSGTVRIDKNGE